MVNIPSVTAPTNGDKVALQEWSSLRDDVFGLKKDYVSLQNTVSEMAGGVRALVSKFDESRKPNWIIVISLMGLVFGILPVMAGGSLWIISGQISQSVSPISARLLQMDGTTSDHGVKLIELARATNEQAREISNIGQQIASSAVDEKRNSDISGRLVESSGASSIADGVSRTDRAQLDERVRTLEVNFGTAVSERKGEIAEINARLLEVEQQFHAISNISNMRWAEQNRNNSMVYEKLHPGERYPTETFYPASISRPSAARN